MAFRAGPIRRTVGFIIEFLPSQLNAILFADKAWPLFSDDRVLRIARYTNNLNGSILRIVRRANSIMSSHFRIGRFSVTY